MRGRLYGYSAPARSGKDTFSQILARILREEGKTYTSTSFAWALKEDLDPFLKDRYGISAFTEDSDEKVVIRPHLVEHGARMRRETGGRYWIDKVDTWVGEALMTHDVVAVRDTRYLNELSWAHSLGGKIVYIVRTLPGGAEIPPANEEEAASLPEVRARADLVVTWPTVDSVEKTLDKLTPFVYSAWSQLKTL